MKHLSIPALFVTALTSNALAGTFLDDFSAGLSPTYWSITQTTTNLYSVQATGSGIALAKTAANPGGIQNVAIVLSLAALGGNFSADFSAQVDFTNAIIGPNVDQVELHAYFADSSYFFDVYDLSSGRNVHVWNGSINGATPETATFGTFKISRTGSIVTGYFNGTPIFSTSNSSALTGLSFILQNQPGSDDYPSVTYRNLSLTGTFGPNLTVIPSGANVILMWPANTSGFSVQWAPSLVPPVTWNPLYKPSFVVGAQNAITNPISGPQNFYRLTQ
jgi:hypothetical protein